MADQETGSEDHSLGVSLKRIVLFAVLLALPGCSTFNTLKHLKKYDSILTQIQVLVDAADAGETVATVCLDDKADLGEVVKVAKQMGWQFLTYDAQGKCALVQHVK